MARDYKHIAQDHGRRKPSPPWVWLLAGLAIGLFVALLVYLGKHESVDALPSQVPQREPESNQTQPAKTLERAKDMLEAAQPPKLPKPQFEFYTILPEMEVQVPDHEVPPPSSLPERRATDEQLPDSVAHTAYVLQVGSFRRHQDADRLKAELALMGLQADIQVVSLGEKDTWHRVRLGPYLDLKTLKETRHRLSEHNMQAILLKERK